MAEDPHNTSDISENVELTSSKEDAETTAARRELKQTSISEKSGKVQAHQPDDGRSGSEDDASDEKRPERVTTPEVDAHKLPHEELREHVSSPKKKRAHDELEEQKDAESSVTEETGIDRASSAATVNRTDRTEPEKKRARDLQADGITEDTHHQPEPSAAADSTKPEPEKSKDPNPAKVERKETKAQTSSSAFANSPFAKLATSSTSGFGALGASGKPSIFGASSSFSSSESPNATPAAPPKLTFGGGSTGPSPFAIAATNGTPKSSGFGNAFGGGGFGSTLGPRLTSFASRTKVGDVASKDDKPAKPFGAPDSDAEDGDDDDEEERSGDESAEAETKHHEDETEKDKEESKASAEEKKKLKLQKIVVDDGESQEVTLLSVRTKMYQLDKGTLSWKERGSGMLKINVPKASVEVDEAGNPDPSTFDASVLDTDDGEEAKSRNCVRLVMRQDQTHRLLLNTTIIPATKFKLTQRLKAAYVLFTAFDPDEVKQVQVKLSEANALLFMNTVELVQKELAAI